jgi:hypothetical protein
VDVQEQYASGHIDLVMFNELKGFSDSIVPPRFLTALCTGLLLAKAQLAKLKERYQNGIIPLEAYNEMRLLVLDKL